MRISRKWGTSFESAVSSTSESHTILYRIELSRAFTELEKDPRVNVIVLGATGKIFCAGFDFRASDFSSLERNDASNAPPIPEINKKQRRGALFALGCNKPTICAIQGAAIGVGSTRSEASPCSVSCSKSFVLFN